MYNKTTKIIAGLLILMLSMSYFNIIGEVIATSIESQTSKTSQTNVEFDAYFDAENQKTHSAKKNIGEENYLNLELNVKEEGYLKNIVVELEEANFNILETENEQIAKIEDNKVYLNQINNGSEAKIQLPIGRNQEETILPSELSKESKVKFTAIYMNGEGKEKEIEKEVTLKLDWAASNLDAEFSMQIAKFIPYEIKEEKGLVLQALVQSNIKENSMPVKTNKIEIEIPKINEIEPQEVKISANATEAANGDKSGVHFSEENYKVENGKITIVVENKEDKQGRISWKKDAIDEFTITCVYGEDALQTIGEDGVNLKVVANNETVVYDAQATKIEKELNAEVTLKDQISNLVDFYVTSNKETISKGQIYANYIASNKIETEIEESITANIGLAEFTDKIIIEAKEDNFKNSEEEKSILEASYIKEVKIDKEEAEKILGENLEIKIFANETEIATINNESKKEEYTINTAELNVNTLRIETSKPQVEGKLNITILRAIKGETEYSKSQIANFNKFEMNIVGKAESEEEIFVEQNVAKEITLTEPKSEAELKIENSNLSTVVENKNVKITAILKTDTLDCNLYKNPTIEITLPSYIENVNIKNIETLFDKAGSELKIKSSDVQQNENGTKTIVIILEGTQTEYSLNAVAKGLNIVITADLTLNKLTPNREDEITMVYTNANVVNTSNGTARAASTNRETNTVTAKIQSVAPVGVITTSKISNYKEGAESLEVISGEAQNAVISTYSSARTATLEMNVLNNYNNTIDHVSVLGRTMAKENKDIVSGEDLGTTFTAPLQGAIRVTGLEEDKYTVYYSENAAATAEINLESNAWTTTPENYENVKSYLIILAENYVMETGSSVSFAYDVQIPENLQYNESSYEEYVAYFNNNLSSGTVEDKQQAAIVGITTGRGAVLETSFESNIDENTGIKTGKFIKYKLSIKNTGTEAAENVVANVDLPEGLTYIEFTNEQNQTYTSHENERKLTFEFENIGVNESKEADFWVVVNNLSEEREEVSLKASITANGIETTLETEEVKNTLLKAYFNIDGYTSVDAEEILSEGEKLQYNYTVKLYEDLAESNNAVVTMVIPDGLKYESAKIRSYNLEEQKAEDITDGIEYSEATKTLKINLGKITNAAKGIIEVNTIVEKLPSNVYEKEIKATISAKSDDYEEETSKELINFAGKEDVTISQTSTIINNQKIATGEDYSYKYEIKNTGGKRTGALTFKTEVPEELTVVSAELQIGEKTYKYNGRVNNKIEITTSLEKDQTAKITINVVAKALEEDAKISSVATVSSDLIEEKTSNTIQHTILKYDGQIENPENPEKQTKRIMGTVWEDSNADGKRDEKEKTVEGVEMLLFNNVTGTLVTDNTGNTLRLRTDNNGTYTFAGIEQGKYTVIFLYDTANYSATVYRKSEVDESLNSDAVDTKITLDGITRVAAITEEVVVSENNVYGIDLGLVSNPKFDLKLDKVVSKITVQDSTGTNIYEYNDSKLAKKDLVGKQIANTTVMVEYKIRITNEGAVSGFVKKIADYMPQEMKFSSELNKDWYASEKGTLYNSSLANTIINPGETKEVILILTKKMTENNLGLYHNEAEIYEAYNDLGIDDVDSKAGNKASTEDDISSADVLITVKTGEVPLFIGLSVTIIAAMAGAAYFIKKKVIR